jgi:glycosyltransferase involved in cell wall biosynthesis
MTSIDTSAGAAYSAKVSVVITCYKYAHFLPFAMDSALGQTHQNVEVIMVNDGSPDNTDEVMQRYLSDPRVVYVKQENAGQAVAKNNGIQRATGDFVAFLDADDIWQTDKLEKQLPLFANPEVGVVYCRVKYMDEKGTPVEVADRALWRPKRGRITADIFLDNLIPFCAAVVRRSCFDKVGVMDPSFRMGIDWDLWLRMSVNYQFDFVDEPLLNYRVGHAGQMSKNYLVREQDTMRIMEQFVRANPGLLPESLIRWAYAYSYCNRGYYFRRNDRWKSLSFYFKAIRVRWQHVQAYLGIVKWLGWQILSPLGLKR